jgi:hypothetical protein
MCGKPSSTSRSATASATSSSPTRSLPCTTLAAPARAVDGT